MPCNVIYSCKKKQIGTLIYHNLKINDKKWNYPDSSNPTSSEKEIVDMAISANCNEDELIILGFVRGWVVEC